MKPPEETSEIDPQIALGDAVRILRKRLELSQENLAERAGLPPSWLAHLESGNRDPTWGDMRHIAKGLEVSLEELSELAEELEGGRAAEPDERPSS